MARGQGWIVACTLAAVALVIAFSALKVDNYFFISAVLLVLGIAPFFIRFERRRVDGRELVFIAMLAAIAAVSRVPFASIPSVQPTTFVIIMSGLAFGSESGFVVGALAAIVSNLFLGQGPWTPWQMTAWGLIGAASGGLRHTALMRGRWGRCLFGFVAGFLFGWFMNVSVMFSLGAVGLGEIVSLCAASFFFDLAHALSNVFFLYFFGNGWLRILHRFKRKYGLLDR